MKSMAVVLLILSTTFILGCTGMNNKQQATLSGAGIGAVGGGVIGAASGGSPVTGAILGAGAGAATGYVIEKNK